MSRVALITGISGQDGSYLSELLLAQGYAVHGLTRRRDDARLWRLAHLLDRVTLHEMANGDPDRLARLLAAVHPTEIYNLAAPTYVPDSWAEATEVAEAASIGVARLLEAVRQVDPSIRLCQAGSSEMFGSATESPQNEQAPFCPRNPYGAAKVFAHHLLTMFRDRYGLFACDAILFNHESPRRGPEFVTRKITRTAALIKLGAADELRLESLDACRDWGFAGDYVEAMWRMLQRDSAADYVIGTGVLHSVQEFVAAAFGRVGLDWRKHVKVEGGPRPNQGLPLVADARKARAELGWQPKAEIDELAAMMVDADLADLAPRVGRAA
jgi:GDPmannose 4,6-dehydratase